MNRLNPFRRAISALLLCALLFTPLAVFARDPFYPSKDQVGLNVHWALGGFGRDDTYESTLDGTNTRWAREHFSTDVFYVDQPGAWFDRYDAILEKYADHKVKVVGMLMYGFEDGEISLTDLDAWESHVRLMVERYGDRVKYWQVWNEPNSPDYLSPNSIETYGPILERSYDAIKDVDPDATVITAGLAGLERFWAERLVRDYRDSFDVLALHTYYCRELRRDGDLRALDKDVKAMHDVLDNYEKVPVWITENGCSRGSKGISQDFQERYLRESTQTLLNSGWIERVFVYNIRDYDTGNAYEDQFGLLGLENHWNVPMKWYDKIPIGPYNKRRLVGGEEQERAVELRARLSRFFPYGLPVSAENWGRLVNAYVYGGYPVQAIVQTVRYGAEAAAVHPSIAYEQWKEQEEYQKILRRDFTAEGLPIFAYGRARIDVDEEAKLARRFREELEYYHVPMPTPENWGMYVNARVYGGYTVLDIVHALKYGGKTVHASIPKSEWQDRAEYKETMAKPL